MFVPQPTVRQLAAGPRFVLDSMVKEPKTFALETVIAPVGDKLVIWVLVAETAR
jgi:hypothetical protein